MPDKLTDKEIVKALKELLKELKGKKQLIVPEQGVKNLCYGLQNFLDLINRLQAKLDEAEDTIQFADKELKKAEAENERLNIRLRKERDQFADIGKMYSEVKAEAYKEFAERLKHIIMWSPKNHISITAKDVEMILKEMVGEDK